MISVLCGHSKKIYHFPDAVDICPSAHCPDLDCKSTYDGGMCVLRSTGDLDKDGDLVIDCIATFPGCMGYTHCGCTSLPCEHIGPLQDQYKRITATSEELKEAGKRAVRAKMADHLRVKTIKEGTERKEQS